MCKSVPEGENLTSRPLSRLMLLLLLQISTKGAALGHSIEITFAFAINLELSILTKFEGHKSVETHAVAWFTARTSEEKN